MRLVILESPYAASPTRSVEQNIEYARACVRDSVLRMEAPIASHLLYTQPGILKDEILKERVHGINAGLAWYAVARACVVYRDHGISTGMLTGINVAISFGVPVEYRELGQ